jgi:hypothetical protein
MNDITRTSNTRVAALRHLHDKLKSGEYDGTDVMAAWIAVEDLACLLERAENEPPADPVGFVARSKVDGTIFRDFAKPGERHPINDQCEWMPVYDRPTLPPSPARYKEGDRVEWTNILRHTFVGTVLGVEPESRYVVQLDDGARLETTESELRPTLTKGEG